MMRADRSPPTRCPRSRGCVARRIERRVVLLSTEDGGRERLYAGMSRSIDALMLVAATACWVSGSVLNKQALDRGVGR